MEAHITRMTPMEFFEYLKDMMERCTEKARRGEITLARMSFQRIKAMMPIIPPVYALMRGKHQKAAQDIMDAIIPQCDYIINILDKIKPHTAYRNAVVLNLN